MEAKRYVIKSDKEGYFYGPIQEMGGSSIFFTDNITCAKLYDHKSLAIDDMNYYKLDDDYFHSYIVPVVIDVKEVGVNDEVQSKETNL